ncbi:MAG: serine hydrolase [Alphaproteobacteria bacterium]|nr:serine hydrolase [Alphaproteobacteria bacterium]
MRLPRAVYEVTSAWMTRSLMLLLALATFSARASADEPKDCGSPVALNDGWSLASQAEAGLDAAKLCGLDTFLQRWPDPGIHAVVVVRNGKLAMERYFAGDDSRWGEKLGTVRFGPEVKHDLKSISKSATSLLVGIALGEGKFPALDSPVFDAFPEDGDLRTPEKSRLTFRHLLTMSSGLAWEEDVPYADPRNDERAMLEARDPFRYILSRPMASLPGSTYHYSGGVTSLLGETLVRSTGRSLADYAREKLFLPIEAPDFEWLEVGLSRRLGAYGSLRMRPRDAAKLGRLLLGDGAWNGKQVVPAGWAAQSITPRLGGDGLFFYGYQWWLGRTFRNGAELPWAAGYGIGGQRLFVVPRLDLVVMISSGLYDRPLQFSLPNRIFTEVVLPAVKD